MDMIHTLLWRNKANCSLVGLCVVLVVLDPPGLKGVDERHEGQRAHNVLQQLVVAEAAVTTIMANHKELQKPHAQAVHRRSGGTHSLLWLNLP